jgi:rod shape-determining protein MreD
VIFSRRRRRAKASNPQAARMPRHLSFRRRRTKPAGKPAARKAAALSFRRRRPKLGAGPIESSSRGLSFRRGRPTRTAKPPERKNPRLSFRRGRPRPTTAGERTPRRLSFRRARSRSETGLLARAARMLGLRQSAAAAGVVAPRRKMTLHRDKQSSSQRPERWRAPDPLHLTARLIALGFAACMLQLLILSQISVLGVSADLAPLVVVSAGFLCGSLAGAGFGFGVGLFIDLASVQVLGISSLLLTLIGYGAGRVRESRAPEAPLTRLALGAAATVLAIGGYGAIEFMLGVNTPLSYGLLGAIVKTTLLNSLISVPVYALTRRVLLGALPMSEREINRPATTTRISPLTRA